MRFINLGKGEPNEAWRLKAKALSDRLDVAGSKAERDKIIRQNSAVWGELKPWLLEHSKGKCWFSEARDYFSHWDVEHYRPKSAAKDADGAHSFRSGPEPIKQLLPIGTLTTSFPCCSTQPGSMTHCSYPSTKTEM